MTKCVKFPKKNIDITFSNERIFLLFDDDAAQIRGNLASISYS